MGKGKGSNYNFFIQVYPGLNLLLFFNWEKNLLLYILKILLKIIPSKNKYILNF